MSDPSIYRDQGEVEEWMVKDPIDRFKTFSMEEDLLDAERFAEIDREVEAAVDEAIRFAEESPEPELDSRYENVYA